MERGLGRDRLAVQGDFHITLPEVVVAGLIDAHGKAHSPSGRCGEGACLMFARPLAGVGVGKGLFTRRLQVDIKPFDLGRNLGRVDTHQVAVARSGLHQLLLEAESSKADTPFEQAVLRIGRDTDAASQTAGSIPQIGFEPQSSLDPDSPAPVQVVARRGFGNGGGSMGASHQREDQADDQICEFHFSPPAAEGRLSDVDLLVEVLTE